MLDSKPVPKACPLPPSSPPPIPQALISALIPAQVSTALKGQGLTGSPAPQAPMAPCWDLVACQDVKPVTEVGSAPAPMLQKPADSAGKVSSAPEGPPGPIQRPALKVPGPPCWTLIPCFLS